MSLSPSGVVPVCVGDLLTVTCRAEGLSNTDVIQWNITSNVEGSSESDQRLLSAGGQSFISPIKLNNNMMTFNFTLEASSAGMSSVRVTSNVLVNVTPLLNGTVIQCSAISAMQNYLVVGPDTTLVHVITSKPIDTGKWRIIRSDSMTFLY